MAEYQRVIQEAARICREHDECDNCPLREMVYSADICCPIKIMCELDTAKVDAAVMDWAEAHPEPKYPSWNEAWRQLFPNAHNEKAPCPCFFLATERVEQFCYGNDCIDCKELPIPAEIAEKLGIKPIGGENR